MIYTRDNPKLVENLLYFKGKKNFTGVVKNKYDSFIYYLNGEWHREDGPAVEHINGDKFWFLNGKFHRTDGPAIEWGDFTKEWFINNNLHREDGPAVEYFNGEKRWCLNGICYGNNNDFTNESWIKFVGLQLLK